MSRQNARLTMTETQTDAGDAERGEKVSDGTRLAGLDVRLKNLRRARGRSLQAVAEAGAVSPSFLSPLERGHSDVSLGRFARLEEFHGTAPV
jgi:helix-turn-helix protein